MKSYTLYKVEQLLMVLEQDVALERTVEEISQIWQKFLKQVQELSFPSSSQLDANALRKLFDRWFEKYYTTVWASFQVQRALQNHRVKLNECSCEGSCDCRQ